MAEDLPAGWSVQRLADGRFAWHRRFAFGSYRETRAFLDGLARLAEEQGYHPQNINFGATYVNVTLEFAGDAERAQAFDFARRLGALAAEEAPKASAAD